MHELGLALEIVDIVTRRAAGAKVRRVVVEVGALAAVLPDALAFSFQLASDGTSAAGAELSIVELSGDELRVREMEVV
jgi:hydrogenase nickel incorporation protein HypA/HybF